MSMDPHFYLPGSAGYTRTKEGSHSYRPLVRGVSLHLLYHMWKLAFEKWRENKVSSKVKRGKDAK
jgi:hypothetical protein